MGYHAKLSPSSAHRWTECTASVQAQEGIFNESNEASMMGTCCHQISAEVLQDGAEPQTYLGRKMLFWEHRTANQNGEDWQEAFEVESQDDLGLPVLDTVAPICHYDVLGIKHRDNGDFVATVEVKQEMIDAVYSATDFVKERAALLGAHMEVEQRVPIGHITGEDGATGTSDVVLIHEHTIESIDFKYGRHKVNAYDIIEPAHGDRPPVTRMNLQLAMYVLGAYEKFKDTLAANCSTVKATIVQPFLNHVSEFECSLVELLDVQNTFLAIKAEETRTDPVFKPTYDNCHFCKARAPSDLSRICKARQEAVVNLVLEGFSDVGEPVLKPAPSIAELGTYYGMIDFVKQWCDDIAKLVFEQLMAGNEVSRWDGRKYVLVEGRKGDRVWRNPDDVEKLLKSFRLRMDQMYKMKVISPAQAEAMSKKKRAKDAPPPIINSLQWKRLLDCISQADPNKVVALETDTRPVLPSQADGFVDVSGEAGFADLGL